MRLRNIFSAIPEGRWDAKKVAALTESDEAFITEKVGVVERGILGPNENGTTLSLTACRKLFQNSELRPDDVELLVCVTQNPDYRIPQNSALLQAAAGLPDRCASFDISLGCSGYIYALQICKGFMLINEIENGIIVTCDPYSKVIAANDKNTMAVFGDAATVTWMNSNEGGRLGKSDFGTNGSEADSLMINAGGAIKPILSVHDKSLKEYTKEDIRIRMDGRRVFNFVLSKVPESIERCLAINELTMDDIDYFALHQGSLYMLKALAKRAGIPDSKLCLNINRYGNTVSSSVPLLLEDLKNQGSLLPDKNILISGFGVGLSWGTSVLQF